MDCKKARILVAKKRRAEANPNRLSYRQDPRFERKKKEKEVASSSDQDVIAEMENKGSFPALEPLTE